MNKIFLFLSTICVCFSAYAEKNYKIENNNENKNIIIHQKLDHHGKIYYIDSMGRTAQPKNDTFSINIAPGVVFSPASKRIVIVKEYNNEVVSSAPKNKYEADLDNSINLGYFLGRIAGK